MSIDSIIILNKDYDFSDLKSGGHIIAKSFSYETALFLEDNKLEIRDKLYYFSENGFDEYVLCRKPLSEKSVADNILKHGTGGINIDDCRVETKDDDVNLRLNAMNHNKTKGNSVYSKYKSGADVQTQDNGYHNSQGRFPANLIHDGSEEVIECFPDSNNTRNMSYKRSGGEFIDSIPNQTEKSWFVSEKGSSSRFFKTIKTQDELIEYFKKLITPKEGVCKICL